MKIRWKLLILLMAIALVPLIAASVLHRLSMRGLGSHLASGTREILSEGARQQLHYLVDDYGRLLSQCKVSLELALNIQAREVQRRLAGPPPAHAPRLYFSKDYDEGVNLPEGVGRSGRHYQRGPDGEPAPMPVTYSQQVYFVVGGADEQAAAEDMRRLSTMPEAYRRLHRSQPEAMQWQYTALEPGVHTSFPGHGGYPPEYDPRVRPWYTQARAAGELVWGYPLVDVTTGTVMLTLSMPVRRPDGSFAGVTAIDLPVTGIFEKFKLPEQWAAGATTLFVAPAEARAADERRLLILAQKSYQDTSRHWQTPVELEYLTSDDPQALKALAADAAAGRSGVRHMGYRGQDSLWAHGKSGRKDAFPVVIVPYDRIVAQAAEAEKYVLRKTIEGLKITGGILLGAVAAVAAVALWSSRSVTRPVRQLAEASKKLAGGDYAQRVDIRTGDELQELGEVFNQTGPKLQERERMKQSLALAMEIQQQLLPQEPPQLAGFDIAGGSIYCDETGGDYYDFIDLVDLGAGKLGIAVGDVTGHGIGAALLMASARGVLRSHAGRHGGDLGELFVALNSHLMRDTGDERFMTLFYGVLDADARSLEWTSAGHDPAFWLRRSSGRIEELPNSGIPLGVLDEAAYTPPGSVTIESGDIVLIGTDGIWEAANPAGELFGKPRLRELLASRADSNAAEILSAVVENVNEFRADQPQQDDITLVVIKAQ